MQTANKNDQVGPCAGIKVLDFSSMVSGPLCSQNLGDLGADVIKIENLSGDTARMLGSSHREGLSGFFAQLNRNKRSVTIDLQTEQGQALVQQLARDVDVVVENFRPGVAKRLGIDYELLKESNPGLIYVSITGFGQEGPYAKLPTYDLVIQGLSGMMPIQGSENDPQMFQTVLADKCVAITAASATLAALLARERNGGKGQRVDVPMMDAYAQLMLTDLMTTQSFQPSSELPAPNADLYRSWQTKDGHVVGIALEDHQFRGLCESLEKEEWIDDERFKGIGERFSHLAELYDLLGEEFAKWNTADIIKCLRDKDVPFAPVNSVADFIADPQVVHNRIVFDDDDPQAGAARYIAHPSHYSETPATLRRHPPRLGEHTEEVLREAGLDADQIAVLREAKVLS